MLRRVRRPKRIALALSIGQPLVERVLGGLSDYVRAHGPWQFDFNPETGSVPVESLRDWDGDGIIGSFAEPDEARRAARLGIPTVNLSSAPLEPSLPSVCVDNRAVGELAARHLLDRGFRRFAYYGLSNVGYGRDRGAGFASLVEAAGFSCTTFLDEVGREPWRWNRRQLVRWLERFEPPIGVLAVHDFRARLIVEACAALGLRVPDEVAVVGVDDNVLACELCRPSLTSITLPGAEIGYRAAALLDRLMKGRAAGRELVLVPPGPVVPRRSTEVVAVQDSPVASALRFISEHLEKPFGIDALADHVGLARRSLERRFHHLLRETPYRYISRLRIERAKQLLVAPGRLADVARLCGFSDRRHFNTTFVRLEGCTPRQFRQRLS